MNIQCSHFRWKFCLTPWLSWSIIDGKYWTEHKWFAILHYIQACTSSWQVYSYEPDFCFLYMSMVGDALIFLQSKLACNKHRSKHSCSMHRACSLYTAVMFNTEVSEICWFKKYNWSSQWNVIWLRWANFVCYHVLTSLILVVEDLRCYKLVWHSDSTRPKHCVI